MIIAASLCAKSIRVEQCKLHAKVEFSIDVSAIIQQHYLGNILFRW